VIDAWARLLDRPEIPVDRDRIAPVLQGRRIAITGAGGSIGAALARFASTFELERLILFDSHEASLVRLGQQIRSVSGQGEMRFVLGDVRDRRKLDLTLRRFPCDVIFHLAAYKQVPLAEENVEQVLGVNLVGALNVLEAAQEHGVGTLVYPSTDKAVQPSGVYGASKRIVERFLTSLSAEPERPAVRVVRLVNVFGTQGSVVEVFSRQIAAGQPIEVTDPAMDRYWITMAEATYLLVLAGARPSGEGIYYLDSGNPVRLVETVQRVNALLRPGASDPSINVIGIRPGERLHEILQYSNERRQETDIPGLLVLVLPRPTIEADAWLAELRALRRDLYDLEPVDLRAWLFSVAQADRLSGGPARPNRTTEEQP
jgi:FlaA1/EpsC-like NDP-sugar epimerase